MTAVLTPPLLALAAAEPAAQPISVQTALLVILGIALVFAFASLARLHRRVDALNRARTARSAGSPAAVTSVPLPPEILAVIAAAVAETLGTEGRIVSIGSESQNHVWSMEGRRQIFGSRKIR